MQQLLIAASACAVKINNTVIGYATSVQITKSQGMKVIHGIDNPFPQEIAITGPYMVQGTISGFRSRIQGGWEHLRAVNASTIKDYFNQHYVTLEILDRATGELIARVDKALFTTDSISVGARGVVTMDASFVGHFWTTPLSVGEST